MILHNGAAHSCSVLVSPEFGFGLVNGGKIVPSVQGFVPEELPDAAMKSVGPASGGEVDYSSVEPAKLG